MSVPRLTSLLRHPGDAIRFVIRKRFNREHPESIYFYTFHKCASTLFSGYVLKNLVGLRHVDHELDIYKGRLIPSEARPLTFATHGHVYGPIRVSGVGSGDLIDRYQNPIVVDPDFVRDRIAIFLVRDPRDIIVSGYHSFAFTHGLSRVPELRAIQERHRDEVRKLDVDAYALAEAGAQIKHFTIMRRLADACRRGVVLKYEDLVDDFEGFVGRLGQHVALDPHVVRQMHVRSRPRRREMKSSHRRSGRTGGFRDKLRPDTIAALNERLAAILQAFGYRA